MNRMDFRHPWMEMRAWELDKGQGGTGHNDIRSKYIISDKLHEESQTNNE